MIEKESIASMASDHELAEQTKTVFNRLCTYKYSYHFDWMGRPIIQFPQDIVAMQEIIWQVKPDLIIETGIAHGGSLVFHASMLALLDLCEEEQAGRSTKGNRTSRCVLGIDIDIREHNRKAIEQHPLANRIHMLEGSSIDADIIRQVHNFAETFNTIIVCLDSNHTHDHVLAEMQAYSPLVTKGSYCVVFDTVVEYMPKSMFPNRPWGPGDNPYTAVHAFLKKNPDFKIDKTIHEKLALTVAPDGYLQRI